jgi:IS5 family transposase
MGVKKKTVDALRNFQASVEGNISELKRAFGAGKATWKGLEVSMRLLVFNTVLQLSTRRQILVCLNEIVETMLAKLTAAIPVL